MREKTLNCSGVSAFGAVAEIVFSTIVVVVVLGESFLALPLLLLVLEVYLSLLLLSFSLFCRLLPVSRSYLVESRFLRLST